MPNQRAKGTRPHTVAMPDDLWRRLQAIAARQGVRVSVVVRDALERYVRNQERKEP